ncbi:glutathione S-transferase kappa 1-like isoform X3 [Hemibagrus wyckioides]|uniref:glutathione S-transferase kappa 1-like isoform X3 n=1 Tax=Hemibagrus wyckioides TaxID=337641 RepID=UPI00266C499A|nr:glutathione S-transferase kappa 1-like isoform X3 [Hemibagrus wyckioides]
MSRRKMSQVTRCDSNDSNLLNFGTFPRPHCILQVSCAILRKHQMSNSRKKIELFYDVVSPYTWLAFEVLCRYRKVWNVELKLRPAYLGGVMLGSGSLTAMHFITAVAEKEKDSDRLVENVSRELWKRIWSTDQDICEPVSLSEAGLNAGLSSIEVEELLSLAQSQPIKDKLMQTTQEALDYKAFGFPLIVCHGDGKPQVYFGSDRFELIAHCIGEKWLGPQPDKPTSHL